MMTPLVALSTSGRCRNWGSRLLRMSGFMMPDAEVLQDPGLDELHRDGLDYAGADLMPADPDALAGRVALRLVLDADVPAGLEPLAERLLRPFGVDDLKVAVERAVGGLADDRDLAVRAVLHLLDREGRRTPWSPQASGLPPYRRRPDRRK